MRLVVAVATFAWAAQFSGPAAADLYRWVDPESGSIKFSSYPPPWFGDPAKERRAPKVEVIPERSSAPSSGPKPDVEARPEPKAQARPEPRPVDKALDGPIDRSARSAANPAAKREPAPTKDGSPAAR